jgi:site-specific recombinase XerD
VSASRFTARAAGCEELRSGFLTMLAVERGLSANTLEAYALDLADLRRHCESNHHEPRELGPAVVVEWLESALARGTSVASRRRYYSVVTSFSAYLVRLGVLKANGARALKLRSAARSLPRVPSPQALETLLRSIGAKKRGAHE